MQLGILKITFANGKASLSFYSLDKTTNSIFVDEKLNYSENEKRYIFNPIRNFDLRHLV